MYIGVDKSVLRSSADKYSFVWTPMALLEIPSCSPKTKYIVDCCINDYVEPKSISRFFLINKIPYKVNILYSPTVMVPHAERRRCSFQEFISDLNYAVASLAKAVKGYTKPPTKPSSLWRTTLMSLFFPFKLLSEASMREATRVGEKLMYGVLKDILELLCLDRKPLPQIHWSQVYVLTGIDFDSKRIEFFVGSERIRSRAYEKYVFKNKDLVEMFRSTTKKISGTMV